MNAQSFFTDAEQQRIQRAVLAAEARTAGEIVPMIVTSSARYTEIELLGLVAGLFIGIVTEWFWSDPWGIPTEKYRLYLVRGNSLVAFSLDENPDVPRQALFPQVFGLPAQASRRLVVSTLGTGSTWRRRR